LSNDHRAHGKKEEKRKKRSLFDSGVDRYGFVDQLKSCMERGQSGRRPLSVARKVRIMAQCFVAEA